MRPLLLVRHPPPLVEPGVPPDRWGLGADGVRWALAMGDHLPFDTGALLSSTAPVAAQTARAIAGTADHDVAVLLDDRLGEVAGAAGEQQGETVERYLDGELIEGWEPPGAAVARLSSALLTARRRDVRATAIVTHGIVLTLWLAPRLGVDPRRLWRQLTMPDLWWYHPGENTVSRVPVRQRAGLATPRQVVG